MKTTIRKKRIYIAYTGGTIGMFKSKNGFIPKAGFMKSYLESLSELQRPEMPSFYLHEYTPLIDSSDMSPKDWQRIANDIKINYDNFDGFIILHGTDTMAYTASALSFMLKNLDKPVIITGSQIPISALRSDGQANLLNALYIAAYHPIHEVCLFFNNTLLRGNRSTKSRADGFNAFSSPNIQPILEVGINIKHNHIKPIKSPNGSFCINNITPQPIGVVMLYPGISVDIFRNVLQQPVNALILLTFGVGNAPQSPELLKELTYANQRGIILLNLTQCLSGKVDMEGYATGNALANVGVLSGFDMTIEAALAKLHFLLSQNLNNQEIKSLLQKDLCGELTV